MMRRVKLMIALLVILTVFTATCSHSSAIPSDQLKAALDYRMEELPGEEAPLQIRVSRIIERAQTADPIVPRYVAIEAEAGKKAVRTSIAVPAGTIREQLDMLTDAAGYTWQANGDWINLIPKSKAANSAYIMNKRMTGKMVFSKQPGIATPTSGWLSQNRVSVIKRSGGLRPADPKAAGPRQWPFDTKEITLENPTLREAFNAHEQVHGNDVWGAHIEEALPTKGTELPNISIMQYSYDSTELSRAIRERTVRDNADGGY